MPAIAYDWNAHQKRLNASLSASTTFAQGVALCREMHAQVHALDPADRPLTVFGELLEDLPSGAVTFRPPNKFASIAWNIWHITRIEDAVANLLIADQAPVLDGGWLRKLGTSLRDTGNALSAAEVDEFDAMIDVEALFAYRLAVGSKTRAILGLLSEADRKRKPTARQLERILEEGVLTRQEESIWLLDFWGRKTVALLLRMPITRHQIVHINDCFRLKAAYRKRSV